jgi:hypothetical protein
MPSTLVQARVLGYLVKTKLRLYLQSSIPGGVGGDAVDAGIDSCFGIPGEDEAETMSGKSSIPEGVGGNAVDAGTGSCFGIPGEDKAETV